MEMTKKLLIAALALLVTVPMALAVDNSCVSGTPTLKVVMVGSSAQFNATAFAAQNIINGESGSNFNLFSVKGKDINGTATSQIIDSRISGNPSDSATMWVAWDALTPSCNVWVYFSTDSAVGVKDFMAYGKVGTKSYAFAYGQLSTAMDAGSQANWCTGTTKCSQNKVFGLSDTTNVNGGDNLPTSIITLLNKIPSTDTTAPAYCASGVFCYFNAAATDIRPEDALYGTTRALSNYDTKSLNGLGYNSSGCGGDGLTTGSKVGCGIYSSMGTGSVFHVATFKISGSDPISSGAIPASQTLTVGASPLVVFVNNHDTTNNPSTYSYGFGATNGSGQYLFTNINRYMLSQVFQGNVPYTVDLLNNVLPYAPLTPSGTPTPIQVVQREMLSGTYNTFEFTGVRVLSGSGNPLAVKTGTTNITSNAWSGQELGINPASNNFQDHAVDCPTSGFPTGAVQCTDPLWLSLPGGGLRLRAIGTGEEVPAVVDTNSGQSASHSATPDGIGYAFWSFGNMKPAAGLGHYLTVDGIDPLYNVPTDNPAGAYNIPTCAAPPCGVIPFTHVNDGTYPLWSFLRVVTFKTAPAAVTQLVNTEITQSNTDQLDDYQPLLDASGNLQVFVFRSHYKQTNSPNNGHKICTKYNPPTPSTCLVDAGGDVGGAIVNVQADSDFFIDSGVEITGVRQ
jgi:hypothetical protein